MRDDRPARGGRSDRGDRGEIFGRNERPVRDQRSRDDQRTRGERPARSERRNDDRRPRGERPFRDDSFLRSERPAHGERAAYGERPARTTAATPDGAARRGSGGRSAEFSPRDGTYSSRGPRFSESRSFDGERPRRKPPRAAPQAAAPTPKTPGMPEREGERIAKLLARAGVASRREAERLIIEGRVKLGDDLIETPSTVLTSLRGVTVDGNPVREAEETRLFAFHKPAGLLTAERDPGGRPTIYTALRNALPEGAGRVMPIGRLDLNTEGLLLLTNDGAFKRELELPATGVPRTYRARTFGDISQAQLEDLIEGIEIEGVVYGKIDANMERRTGRNQWIEMTLTEGKNREVRRVLEHLGLQVSRLIRTSYGPFRLLDLPKGTAFEVAPRDLENFRRTLSGGKS
ncbi:MAG: pseudouridine synthase [Novosphingobium lindaniclasticum]|jgi:23S rRNA pseudouridine2605 synthase|uniref:pseudouridine synthase n=1 Tax=Novosphingobium lindaniclasticum TaxID=1329895 RepID=UPI003C6DFB8C|nr:pseudouridine synthase [Novosphingobium lindaniclasticum]